MASKIEKKKPDNNEDNDCRSTEKSLRRMVSNKTSAGIIRATVEYA